MGRRSDYRKDRSWDAWDMNCRRICPVSSPSRRKLRDILRRQARKRDNLREYRFCASQANPQEPYG